MTQPAAGETAPHPHEEARITEFVREWYRRLDEHVPADDVGSMVVDQGLEFVVPEATLRSREEVAHWYTGGNGFPGVINIFFDEVHTVTSVAPTFDEHGLLLKVVVNWQCRRWNPPAPRSEWLGFDAFQTWRVVPVAAWDDFLIARYVVDELRPMPGSPPL